MTALSPGSPRPATDDEIFDPVAREQANREGRRLRGSGRLLSRAVVLVWRAGRLRVVAGVVFAVLTAVTALAQVAVIQVLARRLLENAGSGADQSSVVLPLFVLIGLTALGQLVAVIAGMVQRELAQRVLRAATGEVFDVASAVPYRNYEEGSYFQDLVRVATNSVDKPTAVVQGLLALTTGLLTSLALIGFVATIDPWLVPMLLATALPAYVTGRVAGQQEFDFVAEQVMNRRRRDYAGNMLMARVPAKELRSFDAAREFRGEWDELWGRYLDGLRALTRTKMLLAVIGTLSSSVALALVGLYVVRRVGSGAVPVASAGAAIIALRLLSTRVQEFARGAAGLLESRLYLSDLSVFRERYPAAPVRTAPDGSRVSLPAPSRITLREVGFTYPSVDVTALDGVSLTVERGQTVALVGENGSGKTTLAMVLSGLHLPTAGRMDWDGEPITEDLLPAVREHVCVVFQDFVRYRVSAAMNIALRRDRLDDPAVRRAAEEAGVDFLESLPAGFDTMLTNEYRGGREISGGQWQKVAIARAFYRDSPVILLDEPSAALDARAEHALFEGLRRRWQGKTVVYISHRLATVRSADLIVVLHQGRVDDTGTHEELLARGGRYAELYELQARGFRDE